MRTDKQRRPEGTRAEAEVGRAFLAWYNKQHGTKFVISGSKPDEQHRQSPQPDFEARCCLTGREMYLEVTQRPFFDYEVVQEKRRCSSALRDAARPRADLAAGRWQLFMQCHAPPVRARKRRVRIARAILEDVGPALPGAHHQGQDVPLLRAASLDEHLAGCTVHVLRLGASARFDASMDWWSGGRFERLDVVLDQSLLSEACKKFASVPAGSLRVALLWCSIPHIAAHPELWVGQARALIESVAGAGLDEVYFLIWSQEEGLGSVVPLFP